MEHVLIEALQPNSAAPRDEQVPSAALYVVKQLIKAVRLDIAEPEVRLTEQQQAELNPAPNHEAVELAQARLSSDETLNTLDDAQLWPEEDEWLVTQSPVTETGFYEIHKEFWDSDDNLSHIDWATSLIRIPVRFIISHREETAEARVRRVEMSYINKAILYFKNPDKVISQLTNIPFAPSPSLLTRYASAQTYFWSELIAATLRFIAIEQPALRHGVGVRLIEHVRHYGEVNGLWELGEAPSPSMISNIVGQLVRHWQAGATDDSVLVSPSAKRLPPKPGKSDSGQ